MQNNNITSTLSVDSSLPPAYSTAVLVTSLATVSSTDEPEPPVLLTTSSSCSEIGPRVLYNSHTNRHHTLDHQRRSSPPTHRQPAQQTQTLPANIVTHTHRAQTLTAHDVAQLLRPRKKRSKFQRASSLGGCVDQSLATLSIRNSLQKTWSRSVEELIINAVPPGQSSAICLTGDNDKITDDNIETKPSSV